MRNLWGITIPFSEILRDRNCFSFAGFNANINSRLSNKEFKKTKKNISKSRFSSGKIASFRFSHRSEQKALFAEAKQTPKPIYEFNICLRNCQGNVIQSIFIPDFQSIVFHTIWIKKVRIHVILFAFPIKTIKHMSLEADNSEQRKQKPDVPLYRNDGTVFCRTYLAFMVLWNFINLFSHSRVPGIEIGKTIPNSICKISVQRKSTLENCYSVAFDWLRLNSVNDFFLRIPLKSFKSTWQDWTLSTAIERGT